MIFAVRRCGGQPMKYSLNVIRVFFFLLCVFGGVRGVVFEPGLEELPGVVPGGGGGIGALTILVDLLLKGFSLRR